MKRYIVSVDLGQAVDPTAVCVLERVLPDGVQPPTHPYSGDITTEFMVASARAREQRAFYRKHDQYHLVHLERAPLGTPYPKVVEHVAELVEGLYCEAPVRYGQYGQPLGREAAVHVTFDATGVGAAVGDMLRSELAERWSLTKRELSKRLSGLIFTSGTDVTSSPGRYHVPKRDLVSLLDVMLQTGRLKIAAGLPLAEALTDELLNVRRTVSVSGREAYGAWRENVHDDCAFALAVGLWIGDHTGRPETGDGGYVQGGEKLETLPRCPTPFHPSFRRPRWP